MSAVRNMEGSDRSKFSLKNVRAVQQVVPLVLVIAICSIGLPGSGALGRGPDIVLMMADDMGYSDLGCYGSEISTPNLDALANHGVRFTQFYNTSRCCPSRASLLTGMYSHQVGIGRMNTADRGPGYRGQLSTDTPTIAEVLGAAGYRTSMVGKWHLTMSKTIDQGPNGSWPLQRGFDQWYGSMEGAKNYFRTKWLFDNEDEVLQFKDDFFYTRAISDRAAAVIRDQPPEQSLFSYVAFYAPHFPLQAPEETIAKYRGKYASGWRSIREARFQKQKELGIVSDATILSPPGDEIPDWKSLSVSQRDELDLRMAIYAAQIHELDQGVGNIVEALKETGRFENTLILFLSDNGGTNSGGPLGSGKRALLGGAEAELHSTYGGGWANVSNTPFRQYKANTHEGGVRAPMVVHWPARLGTASRILHRPAHIIDLTPTCIDAAGFGKPAVRPTFSLGQLEGKSLLESLATSSASHDSRALFFEHMGSRASRDGKWKLVNRDKGEQWELYDLTDDPTELIDLASSETAILGSLAEQWNDWAQRCDVIRARPETNSSVKGASIRTLSGVVADDVNAVKYGRWKKGDRLSGYYGEGYLYTSDDDARIEYLLQVPDDRRYELRLLYSPHENRGDSVPITVIRGIESTKRLVNMKRPATRGNYKSLGFLEGVAGTGIQIRIEAKDAGGIVHADAVQLAPVD
ncbi:MAG: sulfatase-like hydrolase/transferase [Rubripirellula sp.]